MKKIIFLGVSLSLIFLNSSIAVRFGDTGTSSEVIPTDGSDDIVSISIGLEYIGIANDQTVQTLVDDIYFSNADLNVEDIPIESKSEKTPETPASVNICIPADGSIVNSGFFAQGIYSGAWGNGIICELYTGVPSVLVYSVPAIPLSTARWQADFSDIPIGNYLLKATLGTASDDGEIEVSENIPMIINACLIVIDDPEPLNVEVWNSHLDF